MADRIHLEEPGSPFIPVEIDPYRDLVPQHAPASRCARPLSLAPFSSFPRDNPVYGGGTDVQQLLPASGIQSQPLAPIQVVNIACDECFQKLRAHVVKVTPDLENTSLHRLIIGLLSSRTCTGTSPMSGFQADPARIGVCFPQIPFAFMGKDMDGILAVVPRCHDELIEDFPLLFFPCLPVSWCYFMDYRFPFFPLYPHCLPPYFQYEFLSSLGLDFLIMRKIYFG